MNKALFDPHNSLLYWFPKVFKLDIPVPKTAIVKFPRELGRKFVEEEGPGDQFKKHLKRIENMAEKIGYPVFIRTDMASCKHGWVKAAFVRHKGQLEEAIARTIEFNEMAGFMGLNYKAIVIREFMELDWRFTAFHGRLPIARERRYFVFNGQVLCHHPYWIQEAIEQAHKDEGKTCRILGYMHHKLPNTWRKMLASINTETQSEIRALSKYAKKVSEKIRGYWSVDFACTRSGRWILIDMAKGLASAHVPCNRTLKEIPKNIIKVFETIRKQQASLVLTIPEIGEK